MKRERIRRTMWQPGGGGKNKKCHLSHDTLRMPGGFFGWWRFRGWRVLQRLVVATKEGGERILNLIGHVCEVNFV